MTIYSTRPARCEDCKFCSSQVLKTKPGAKNVYKVVNICEKTGNRVALRSPICGKYKYRYED